MWPDFLHFMFYCIDYVYEYINSVYTLYIFEHRSEKTPAQLSWIFTFRLGEEQGEQRCILKIGIIIVHKC